MKKEYESPVLEIFSFETKDTVMEGGGECSAGYTGPGCVTDGTCIVDGWSPNLSGF